MRRLTTYNLQLTTYRKAFTLMEILVAAGIFAVVMVITVGIIGQSSSFRTKIKATREASEETKKISDMITRNVKESDSSGKILLCTNSNCATWIEKSFKNGIAMISGMGFGPSPSYVYGSFQNNNTSNAGLLSKVQTDPDSLLGNILITTTKDKYRVMAGSMPDGSGSTIGGTNKVFYMEFDRIDPATGDVIKLTPVNLADVYGNLIASSISNPNLDTKLRFCGFAPDDASTTKQQAYVQFDISSETSGYATKPVNSRAKMEIRSLVTARSFAN